MRRIVTTILVISTLVAWAAPADAAVKKIPTRFVDPVSYSVNLSRTAVTGFQGKLVSSKPVCLSSRTLFAQYKDANGWRMFGFTNTTAADGAFSVGGTGPYPSRYYLVVLSRKVGNIKCGAHHIEGDLYDPLIF